MKSFLLFDLRCTLKALPKQVAFFSLSLIYETVVLIRLSLYRNGILKSHRPDAPVISVGNLTIGGTGKTPMVDFLLKTLESHNIKSAILTRGYGRKDQRPLIRFCASEGNQDNVSASTLGDEPYYLAQAHPNTPVYVCKRRADAAKAAEQQDQPQMLILDDGYQHLAIHRDLNLLLIDAERGLGNHKLLPLGPLREPEYEWKRADAILVTKSNLGFSDRIIFGLQKELQVDCPIFKFGYKPSKLTRLDRSESCSLTDLKGSSAMVCSGIAQPEGLKNICDQLELKLQHFITFVDHYDYPQEIVEQLLETYRQNQPDYWITTEKDAVKLQNISELQDKVWFLEMEIDPDPQWSEFFVDFLTKNKLV